jgi:hypothetical protein
MIEEKSVGSNIVVMFFNKKNVTIQANNFFGYPSIASSIA